MERARPLVGFVVTLLALPNLLAAAPLNLNFTVERKRFDVERTATSTTNISKEKWGYKVIVENKSFQNLEGLEIAYRVFLLDDDTRAKEKKLKSEAGSHSIATLKNSERQTFETTPVEISKSELKAGWSYTDRANKEKVKDGLAGIWIQVKKGGELVSEYVNPPALKQRAKFE